MFCLNVTYLKLVVLPSSGKKETNRDLQPEIMRVLLSYHTDFYSYVHIDIIIVVVLFIFAENLVLKISGM
jgi:hypothetical protein